MRRECCLSITEQHGYPYSQESKSHSKHVCQITRWCRRLMLFNVMQHNRNSHWSTVDGVFPKAEMRSRDSLVLTKTYAVLRNARKQSFPSSSSRQWELAHTFRVGLYYSSMTSQVATQPMHYLRQARILGLLMISDHEVRLALFSGRMHQIWEALDSKYAWSGIKDGTIVIVRSWEIP